MAFARTVIESPEAAKVIDNEIKEIPRLADIYEGLKWRLARGPDIGYPIPKTNPQLYVTHSYHWNTAAITVAYQFDDDQVEVLAVKVLPVA